MDKKIKVYEKVDQKLQNLINNDIINQQEENEDQNSIIDLNHYNFHFEKSEYLTNIDKPNFNESATLIEFRKKFILYGGISVNVSNNNNNYIYIYSM